MQALARVYAQDAKHPSSTASRLPAAILDLVCPKQSGLHHLETAACQDPRQFLVLEMSNPARVCWFTPCRLKNSSWNGFASCS